MKPPWNIEKLVKKGDYLYAVVREHPHATKHGYVLLHRIVVENSLGRILGKSEIVHHKNGNTKDNRRRNLVVTNNRDHGRLHGLERGRTFVLLCCPNCGEKFERPKNKTHLVKGGNYTSCSPRCRGILSGKIKGQVLGNVLKEFVRINAAP